MSVDHTVTRLLSPEFVRADLPLILALQETSSWNAEDMHVPGVNTKTFLGSLLSLCLTAFAQRTWRSEERCAAVLLGFTKVMRVYAIDSVIPGRN